MGISLHYDLTYKVRWTAFKPHFQFFFNACMILIKKHLLKCVVCRGSLDEECR